jgi:hypothetical protein
VSIHHQAIRSTRRFFIIQLAGCLLVVTLIAGDRAVFAVTASEAEQKAQAAQDSGDLKAAAPYWEYLVQYNADQSNWDGAAAYAGMLAEYYDSMKQIDPARHYYELSNEYWLKEGKDLGATYWERAEQLRTTVEMYVSTSDERKLAAVSLPTSGKLAKFEPAYGTYIGMYSEQDRLMGNNYTRSADIYGKNHALYLTYPHFDMRFVSSYIRRAQQAGAAMQIAWEPVNGLDEVVDGEQLHYWAREMKAAEIPIFLRFACEMNGDWVPWADDPAKYIEKFRLVASIMHEEAPNVAMVWAPNDVPKYSMDQFYPGDEYVDWVGIDMYNEPYIFGDPTTSMMQMSPVEKLDEVYSKYADRKPIMISETAVSHTTNEDGKSHTDWAILNMSRLYEVMPKKYPRLKAITWFNVNLRLRESKNDFLLRDDPKAMDAYKSFIADPYLLSKVETGAKPDNYLGYLKMDSESESLIESSAHIVPFVKFPDVMIGKVVYELDGKPILTSTAPPFALDLRAADVPEHSNLTLRAYNADGQEVASTTAAITPAPSSVLTDDAIFSDTTVTTAFENVAADSESTAPAAQTKSILSKWWEKIKSIFSRLK